VGPELLKFLENRFKKLVSPRQEIYEDISNAELRDNLFENQDKFAELFGELSPLVCADPFSVRPNAGAQSPIGPTREVLGLKETDFTDEMLDCILYAFKQYWDYEKIPELYDAHYIKLSNSGDPHFTGKEEVYKEELVKKSRSYLPNGDDRHSIYAAGFRTDQYLQSKNKDGTTGKFTYVHTGPGNKDFGFLPLPGGTPEHREGTRPRLVYGPSKAYAMHYNALHQAQRETYIGTPAYVGSDLSPENLFEKETVKGYKKPRFRDKQCTVRLIIDFSSYDMCLHGGVQATSIAACYPPGIAEMYLWQTNGPLYGVYANEKGEPIFWSTNGKGLTSEMLYNPRGFWKDLRGLNNASLRSGEPGHSPMNYTVFRGLAMWVISQQFNLPIGEECYQKSLIYITATGADGGLHDCELHDVGRLKEIWQKLPFKVNFENTNCGYEYFSDEKGNTIYALPNFANLFLNNLSREHGYDSPLGVRAPYTSHFVKLSTMYWSAEATERDDIVDMMNLYMEQFGVKYTMDDLQDIAEEEQNNLQITGEWPVGTAELLTKLGWKDPSDGFYKDYPPEYADSVREMLLQYRTQVEVNLKGFKDYYRMYGTIAHPKQRRFKTKMLVVGPPAIGKTTLTSVTDAVDLDDYGTSEKEGFGWWIDYDLAVKENPNSTLIGISQNYLELVRMAKQDGYLVVAISADVDSYRTQVKLRDTLTSKELYASVEVHINDKAVFEREVSSHGLDILTIQDLLTTYTEEV
jgi:hypothetical protein